MQHIADAIRKNMRKVESAVRSVERLRYLPNQYQHALENSVEYSTLITRDLTLELSQLGTGGEIRLVAGQVSKLTITGLSSGHFLNANLTLFNPSLLFAMPLSGAVEPSAKGGTWHQRSTRFEPARYVYKFVSETALGAVFKTIPESDTLTFSSTNPSVQVFTINGKIDEFIAEFNGVDDSHLRASAIIDNLPAGVAISTEQDQVVHRIPQILAYKEAAITSDISAFLNDNDGEMTLNIFSQTDGVVHISGTYQKVQRAVGYQPDSTEQSVSPWHPVTIIPASADPGLLQTTVFSARVQAKGAAHLGLLNRSNTRQGIYPHPHMHLAQPFQPMEKVGNAPITITGCWLLLERPPETETPITLAIHKWNARTNAPGQQIRKTTAQLSPALMDHSRGPDGMVAAWIKLTDPWVLDIPDQVVLHCLVFSETRSTLRMSEAECKHGRLLPLMSQDIRREKLWIIRDFGAAPKALLFELGYETDQDIKGMLTIEHLGGTINIAVTSKPNNVLVNLQNGDITLSSSLPVDLSQINCITQSAVQT